MPKLNKRKCKNCGEEFQKTSHLQSVCGIKCGVERSHELNKKLREKKSKADTKEMKKALMTKPEWMNILQVTFNTFIRTRDKDLPCISCGCKKSNKWDAGHYYPTTYSFLRFNEDNVHKQCSFNCNMNLRGNLHEYRIRLIEKIGIARVSVLDNSRHLKLNLSIPEIQELISEYKFKTKQIK